MAKSVYDFEAYKDYLNARLDDPAQSGGRGARSRLSRAIGVQTAFTAQVLRGQAHFSLEQAEAINTTLGHSDEEGLYFLLLIQRERAGTPVLRQRFEKQLQSIRQGRLVLKNRLGVAQTLTDKDQMTYYSSWIFGAIHALASIREFQTVDAISARLKVPAKAVADAVEFLLACGILSHDARSSRLCIGQARIHLGSDSPLIARHHCNWRLQAMRSLDAPMPTNLHYSSAISVSRADSLRIFEVLARTIEELKPVIRDSKEEQARCLAIDFFEL